MASITPKHIQYLLSAVFLGLGGWCLLFPGMVERVVLKPEFQHLSPTSALLFGCFGAQAILAGTVIALSDFKARTFLVFGLVGSIPFFVFNWYFYFHAHMFTDWMLLDFAGNIAILACGLAGYSISRRQAALPQPSARD